MNKIVVCALSFAMASTAFGETLTCFTTHSSNPNAKPTMTAKIISDSKLEDVTFAKWIQTSSTGLKDYSSIKGTLNESNHSPYRGAMTYNLPNGDTLYLPADLSASALKKALKTGIGQSAGENAVIIGNAKDWNEGSGNHYSYRLSCSSDKR